MSTPTDPLAAFNTTAERRFYPRVAPSRPIYVAFGSDNLGMLLNLGENGLLVSVPSALDLNSVFRVALRLYGIAKPIDVHVRTVWTTESTKRAGIQLLDLSEHDREQLRKWGTLERSRQENAEREIQQAQVRRTPAQEMPAPPPVAEFGKKPFGPTFDPHLPTLAPADCGYPVLEPLAAPRRSRKKKSAAPAIAAWSLLAAVLCLAAALFLDPGLAEQFLGRSIARVVQSTTSSYAPAAPPNTRDTPLNTPLSPQGPANVNSTASLPNVPSAKTGSPRSTRSDADLLDSPSEDTPSKYADPKPSVPKTRETDVPSASQSFSEAAESPAATAQSPNSDSTHLAANAGPAALPAPITPAPSPNLQFAAIARPVDPALPDKSAVVGSIHNSGTLMSAVAPATTSVASTQPAAISASASGPSSNWPSSRTAVSAGKTPFFHFRSNSAVVQMDAAPGAVAEITPARTASFVPLPGERVLDSPTVTMHIQRSVLVPGDRWLWRSRKKLALGELTMRIDPQISRLPVGSGSITVQAAIDKDGRVSNLKPLYGSSDLLPSVSKAIREWRYEPTYLDSKPVETQALIEFDFHSSSHP